MDSSFTEFAAFFRTLKEERGLTQSDIARALEVAPSQPSGWASGRSRPRPETLERMAEVYGLDLDKLLRLCKYRTRGEAAPDTNAEDVEMLALLRKLPDEHRPTVKSILRSLTDDQRKRRVTKQSGEFDRSNPSVHDQKLAVRAKKRELPRWLREASLGSPSVALAAAIGPGRFP